MMPVTFWEAHGSKPRSPKVRGLGVWSLPADYGRSGLPLLRNPKPLLPADIVITESTYGDRQHPDYVNMSGELKAAVERLHTRGCGKLLIPAFAVGRTQDVLYTLGRLFASGAVPRLPVYVDSPLATAATRLVRRYSHLFNEEALNELEASTADEVRLCPGGEVPGVA